MSDAKTPPDQTTLHAPGSGATLPPPVAREGERVGDFIGPYKLLQQIGEGGFGSVFMAEQEKPVARRVALKVIKLGMDTRQVIARFDAERQALALMDHPGIAKVFDAGATDTGRPYFVMELVKGSPITDYCDKNSLAIRERLELLAQVCQAVQHAHTKGIIHRDIKPSNVLVSTLDGQPVAKIIDFGIAKATSSKLTDHTLFTEHMQLIGTPEYMSPEQAEGSLDIDTRTDVYALGVLLYELLTGSTPFSTRELRSAAIGEIQRIIREVDPPRPSTRLTQSADTIAAVAASRRAEPRRLGMILRGELDWIAMKAIEKDRRRRYETANGLAMDIHRYLGGEAVIAAPPSRVYRVRKFVSRNRGVVTAASLVAGALVLGMVGTSVGLANAMEQRRFALAAQDAEARQRTLAETRLQEAEATVKFLDDMLGAADPTTLGKDVTVRSVLDRAAGSLDAEFKDRPLVAARLHATIGRTYMNLGDYAAAEPHLRATLAARRRELGDDHADTRRAVNGLGAILVKKAQFAEAEELVVRALKDHERLFGRGHEITVQTIDTLSQLYASLERWQEATALATELVKVRTASFGRDHLETIAAMNTLAILYSDQGLFDESKTLYEEALLIQERVAGKDHPQTLGIRANLAWVEYSAAMAGKEKDPRRSARRLDRARELNEQALEGRTRILGETHPETLTVMNNLATVYRQLDMHDEADTLALKDLEISVRVLGETHPDTITSIANMGSSLRRRQRYDEAIVYLDRALRNARTALPADAQGLAFILGWYANCLKNLHRYAEAEPMLLEARGIIGRTLGEDHAIAASMTEELHVLYTEWNTADPGKGHDEKAARWKPNTLLVAPATPAR